MILLKKMKFILILTLLMVTMMVAPTTVFAAQPKVELGATETYGVLAGSAITNTGNTVISGEVGSDVGIASGKAFTGQASMTIGGQVNIGNGKAMLAKKDLITAYDDAAGRTPVTRIPSELGGQLLKPGVYDSADGTFLNSSKLTLDAEGDPEGVFIFLTNKTLTTAANSVIEPINGAKFCRVFWKVGSSATLGVNSYFTGHIFALDSITAKTNAKIQGQLLARNGAVTLDNNVITNGFCTASATEPPTPNPTPTPTTLTVNKGVINDDGGTATPSDFKVTVKNLGTGKTVTVASKDVDKYILSGGTYSVRIANVEGYDVSFKGIKPSGEISIKPGENKLVSFIMNDKKVKEATTIKKPTTEVKDTTPTRKTVTGGQLPETSSNEYNVLVMGGLFIILGILGFVAKKRSE